MCKQQAPPPSLNDLNDYGFMWDNNFSRIVLLSTDTEIALLKAELEKVRIHTKFKYDYYNELFISSSDYVYNS